jgi:hypothetical protein
MPKSTMDLNVRLGIRRTQSEPVTGVDVGDRFAITATQAPTGAVHTTQFTVNDVFGHFYRTRGQS